MLKTAVSLFLLSVSLVSCVQNSSPDSADVGPALSKIELSSMTNDGQKNYQTFCQPCHGVQGKADGINASRLTVPPKNLIQSELILHHSANVDELLVKGSVGTGRKGAMPPFGKTLKAYEIFDIVDYIRILANK